MKKNFRLSGLDCANCAAKIEKALSRIEGVQEVSINFMTTKLTLNVDEYKAPTLSDEINNIINNIDPNIIMIKA